MGEVENEVKDKFLIHTFCWRVKYLCAVGLDEPSCEFLRAQGLFSDERLSDRISSTQILKQRELQHEKEHKEQSEVFSFLQWSEECGFRHCTVETGVVVFRRLITYNASAALLNGVVGLFNKRIETCWRLVLMRWKNVNERWMKEERKNGRKAARECKMREYKVKEKETSRAVKCSTEIGDIINPVVKRGLKRDESREGVQRGEKGVDKQAESISIGCRG